MEKSSRLCLSNIWCFCMENGPGLTLSSYRKGEGSTRPSARCMISINVPSEFLAFSRWKKKTAVLFCFSLGRGRLFLSTLHAVVSFQPREETCLSPSKSREKDSSFGKGALTRCCSLSRILGLLLNGRGARLPGGLEKRINRRFNIDRVQTLRVHPPCN